MKFTRNYKIKTGSLKKIFLENKTKVKNANIIFKNKFLNFLLMGIIHYKVMTTNVKVNTTKLALSLFDITAKKKISFHSGKIRSQNASNWADHKEKRYCIILK